MKTKFDVIIAGGGVAGLGTAIAMAEEGRSVLVADVKKHRGKSSPAAGGILDPLLEMKKNSPFLPFCLSAFRAWPGDLRRLERGAGKKAGYLPCGMLYAALSSADEKNLKARYRWQKKTGFPVLWKSREWILKNEPEVHASVRSGLFYPAIGRIQPVKLLDVMKRYARKKGVRFFESNSPARLILKNKKAAGISAGRAVFEADAVINASGSWAGADFHLGFKPPVKPARGQILVVRRNNLKIRSVLHTVNGGYVVPWDQNTLLLGSTVEFAGFHPDVTSAGRESIRSKNQKLIPGLKNCRETASWAGLRPFPKDRFPLIGPTRIPGLYMAAGYYRSGILISFYAGQLLAKTVLSGKMPPMLKPFDPRRFL